MFLQIAEYMVSKHNKVKMRKQEPSKKLRGISLLGSV